MSRYDHKIETSLEGIEIWTRLLKHAPDKIGNVNKSIPPVIKRAQGNNGMKKKKSSRCCNALNSIFKRKEK